jgi:hypothetical protein
MNTEVQAREFIPLPAYNWDERPISMELSWDEVSTALVLSHGDIGRSAMLLRVSMVRLNRYLRREGRSRGLLEELEGVLLARGRGEVISALFDAGSTERRREWAASTVLRSRLAMGDSLSAAPAANSSTTVSIDAREIVYSWRVDKPSLSVEGNTDAESSPQLEDPSSG